MNQLEKHQRETDSKLDKVLDAIEDKSIKPKQVGASLKNLGKKWFAFSRFDVGALEMLGKLK